MLQRQPDTLTISARSEPPVKVSFFGGIDIGRVGHPERTDDGVLQVASMLDLFATKLKVLLQRVAVRDYVDLAAILRTGVCLEDGLGAAVALYGSAFPPVEAVKTLVCFEGDAASLAAADRELPEPHGGGLELRGVGCSQGCCDLAGCSRPGRPLTAESERRTPSTA